jgi:hypothetical protein
LENCIMLEPTTAKSSKIDVLDHGFVRLVDSMGDDLSVVRAARVSYDAAWRAGAASIGSRPTDDVEHKRPAKIESARIPFVRLEQQQAKRLGVPVRRHPAGPVTVNCAGHVGRRG